ncbi:MULTISPECIES: telomere-associated protein Tap [Streptomyces]|uniref:Helix-turn-helix domain-containing protein n=2 Tax=Streptomyces TaxID=1883 RepID=A0ABU4K223_9ACTN|nr:helix-turn-helix domain-containing protein [Streptomyces roseolus]MDX2291798.1 helix-turn-helix domain-containing protein [Streptomyces roseolus]
MKKDLQEEALFRAVEELLAGGPAFPEPAERARLREAAGVTQAALARALETTPQTVKNWEAGRSEPRPPRRGPYLALLEGWAKKYPAPTPAPASVEERPATETPAPAIEERPATATPVPAPAAARAVAAAAPGPSPAPPRPSASRPVSAPKPPAVRAATGRGRPAAAAQRSAAVDPRFANGPLAVIDAEAGGQVSAYCTGGLVLDVPARTLPALVEWTLTEARLGAPRLDPWGRDADPLLALAPAALEFFGLPVELSDDERDAGRLPADHPVLEELAGAQWQLTRRGFGPWARIYRPAQGGQRACVQLCIPSWRALDARSWGHAADLPPADLARTLGLYASRVMTPRGSTAVTGLELMTALHPPTRASAPDAEGRRHSAHNPGSLGKDPVDPAPCEAIDGHPVLAHLPRFHVRGPEERLFEEAYDWARELTDEECLKPCLVGIDVNMAFAAAANGLPVGLASPPVHTVNPAFDAAVPGSWLVDLSHVDLGRVMVGKKWVDLRGDLLPSPFTPTGEAPAGPAWYATPTVAYAVELGYQVQPLEAWLRPDAGRYLDGWYQRLRDAYMTTMGDLGVADKLPPAEFLAAMDGYKTRDPEAAIVLGAIKNTVKGGIGKLQEKARGGGWRPGQPWPALARPTWRPDIRAAVISRARIGMHRKMVALAAATGAYPVAVLSDCAVYAADGPSPLDVLPYTADGKTIPGSFRIGVSPGMVKHEGTQTPLWAEQLREQAQAPLLNLARYIKSGAAGPDTGE